MERVKGLVKAQMVYRQGYTGKGVNIALLDTGVSMHPEIARQILGFRDYVGNVPAFPYDDNGHGTHIAGILAGKQCGMAPGAKLYVCKVLDKYGDGKTENALRALEWILENHKSLNIRILNFSMGYLPTGKQRLQQKLIDCLEALWDEGIIVVTAAGNNGPKENTVTVPGISRKVITVGSSEGYLQEVRYYGRKPSVPYSGRGPTSCCIVKPEILAPGTNILSLSSKGGYIRKSGTSMAAPVVSGALALALEKRPSLTPVEAKLLLYNTVEPTEEKNSAWGLLFVDKLIRML